jgi:myo-inositol-1(or 4)-monophosphatase
MDSECQRVAENVIHRHFPDHSILGEEGCSATGHKIEWIIDPIDGTVNYSRGLPSWCCSVAVRHGSEVLAGCVFVPVLNECYSASADGPASCNGEPIHASNVPTLNKAVFATGIPKDIDPRALDFFRETASRVRKIRMINSAAIETCQIACGRFDGYFEAAIYLWDIAAAGLIAERAGALCSVWPREEEAYGVRFLCTNSSLHVTAQKLVRKHFPSQTD